MTDDNLKFLYTMFDTPVYSWTGKGEGFLIQRDSFTLMPAIVRGSSFVFLIWHKIL